MKKFFLTAAVIFSTLLCGSGAFASGLRVVSLKPNITDIIYALGEGGKLVGVTKYCDIPDGQVKPAIVADYTQPFTERIIALSPDIVLGSMENSSRRSIESLEKLGIRVELFPFSTLKETGASIRAIGGVLGEQKKGDELSKKIDSDLSQLKDRLKNHPKTRVIVVWGLRPMVVAGPGAYMDELLDAIAAQNAVSGTKIKYPRIGIEEMISLAPEVIVDLSMGSEAENKNSGRPWDGIDAILAVKNRRVITMDAAKFRAGPNLPAALEKLALEIHKKWLSFPRY